ncbi:MAG TPA: tetratricopeptide repeat protein, partial [Steroidobacteraceae bacterium]|nr:tetratricopeptide repeat protein [Steroidobacteraceae bacterium]
MTPERWQRVESVFRQAIHAAESERSALLDAECQGDTDLRIYVEEMLAADVTSDRRLRDAIGATAEAVACSAATSWNGRMLGAYRIEGRIAAGGMGVVFRARRSDAQFEREVAIKLLSSPLASDDARRRFRAERQILANLNHPNIAQLLDGGTTEEGTPYLVMEYVDGLPIDAYCDQARLGINERLALFAQVCAAVQYAHQHLVVHRDLKPSNILVTADGTPKLLDFGIAKLLASGAGGNGEAVSDQTIGDARYLTPRHASPEQVRGASITTATDIYSLGVLLYELLCGRFPYVVTSTAPLELERAICDSEPMEPSAALRAASDVDEIARRRGTAPEVLARKVAGELDNIVLKAMRKEPQRRYATASELADDIRNHLEYRPVLARPDTWRYRTRKFLQRHALAASLSVAAVALIAGVITFYTARLAAERDRLALERATSEEVSAFMVGLFENANPNRTEPNVTARQVLDEGAAGIERLRKEQPLVASRLMISMSRAYSGLGSYERAHELLQGALEIRTRLRGPESLPTAEAMHYLGAVQGEMREYKTALETLREALRIRELRAGVDSLAAGETLSRMSQVYMRLGDYGAARDVLLRALPIYEAEHGADSPITAEVLTMLGSYHIYVDEHDRARELLQRALSIREQAFGADDIRVVANVHNLGRLEWQAGRFGDGLVHYRRALAIKEKHLGPLHPDVGLTLYGLATSSQHNGELREARAYYDRAVALQEQVLGPDDYYLAMSLSGRGFLLLEIGDLAGAKASLTRSLAIAEKKWGPFHPDLRAPLAGLAKTEVALGNFDLAAVHLDRALKIVEAQFPPEHVDVLRTLSTIATMHRIAGRHALARGEFEEVLARFERSVGTKHPFATEALFGMGETLKHAGELERAEGFYLAALDNF